MTVPEPPLEAHRYARSQTPESPRPLHIPEPSNIPVLQNQMDPVFNDTTTYDIRPNSQPSTTISEKLQDFTASAPNQNTRNLFDHVVQHRLATGNEDAVESDQQCGQIVSGNQFTENEAISQNLSDTVSNANPPTTQPPLPQPPESSGPQAYLPQQTIRNGRVEIGIIEGRVGQVELDRRPDTHFAETLLAGILGAHLSQ